MPQNQPMYRHIADDLREQITTGQLKPNVKLPTEGELSDTTWPPGTPSGRLSGG